ncbi:hypothetical protein CAAN1_19S01882 [[Candida] anglica]|uniref:Uncharacterized protein n=1 Tax=[Candida] anglica TaxID=148631 RepID=A0ABP0E9P7_9ASCO
MNSAPALPIYSHMDLFNESLFDLKPEQQLQLDSTLKGELPLEFNFGFEGGNDFQYLDQREEILPLGEINSRSVSDFSLQSQITSEQSSPARRFSNTFLIESASKKRKRENSLLRNESHRTKTWSVLKFSPKRISNSVKRSLDDEFEVLDEYKTCYYVNARNPPNPRKRRDPLDLEWKPISIFKVYTNVAPMEVEDTNYHDNIPTTSCFGQINMRIKGAWKRSK